MSLIYFRNTLEFNKDEVEMEQIMSELSEEYINNYLF